MVKLIALSISLCFLLFSGCLAFRQQAEENDCQFNRLNALEPDNRIESEAGFIETWNPTNKQFRCAGVAFSRCTLQRDALRRPSYSNSPQEIFIQQGSGYFGMIFPGCPSTFEEPQESQRERGQQGQRERGHQGQRQSVGDRHQKVHHFREGDVIAVPPGVAFWMYNEQETPVVAVSVLDTSSIHNQLDQLPRRFYLAGNQENEFLQYVQEQQGGRQSQLERPQQSRREGQQQSRREGHQQSRREGQEEEQDENEKGNVLSGFSAEFLEQAFQVNREIVRNLQGKNEDEEKGAIVKVKGGLSIISPPQQSRRHGKQQEREDEDQDQEDEDEDEQEQEQWQPRRRQGKGGHRDNGLEETLCTLRLRSNIGPKASPDIYNPQAGRVRSINDLDFPVLRWIGLSAEFGSLRRNAMFVPHYNLNANSILYGLNGRAHIQIVDCSGNTVFDGELEEGRVLTIPQNFVVAAKSLSEHFQYVAFKTNARPTIATLAGGTSLFNAMPEEVVAQSFGLKREQARQLKNNNQFKFLVPPQSQMRAVA